MAPRRLQLTWPRGTPTPANIEQALRFREGLGEIKTIEECKIQVYITKVWDTATKKALSNETYIPHHYVPFWDQLNYGAIYQGHLYEWLQNNAADATEGSPIAQSIKSARQGLVYTYGVREAIKKALQMVSLTTWSSDLRIPVFDEWIVKEAFSLHDHTPSQLKKKGHMGLFRLDVVHDKSISGE